MPESMSMFSRLRNLLSNTAYVSGQRSLAVFPHKCRRDDCNYVLGGMVRPAPRPVANVRLSCGVVKVTIYAIFCLSVPTHTSQ